MRNAIVTGAYGAIGMAIAEGLAIAGYSVTLVGRDKVKLENAAKHIRGLTGSSGIRTASLDLGLSKEIRAFALQWQGPLHLLVNNAATAPRIRTLTNEGVEVQFAVNVLGYYRMMMDLYPKMASAEKPRIVNVASYWAGGLDLDDPEFKNRRYDNDAAYRQSKQANRMLTAAFAPYLLQKGIKVNACHPGDVNSKLSNDLGFGGHETPALGAATPLMLALSPGLDKITGKYFEQGKETICPFMQKKKEVEALFALCTSYDAP
jgi:NAD(P)-dependent dehydrogenase (short-subunit alcohol dehydrogenase family)